MQRKLTARDVRTQCATRAASVTAEHKVVSILHNAERERERNCNKYIKDSVAFREARVVALEFGANSYRSGMTDEARMETNQFADAVDILFSRPRFIAFCRALLSRLLLDRVLRRALAPFADRSSR